MPKRLGGKRVIVTQAQDFMGPALCEMFAAEGAHVIPETRDLREPAAAGELVREAGHVDILAANLMQRNRRNPAPLVSDEEWADMFDMMVHPLHRLIRAVLPQMMSRRKGKIVVMGSANGLRGTAPRAAYSAARGAQLTYVKTAGVEAATHNVNINAIAQNWTTNPTSFTPEIVAAADFPERLREVPMGRLAYGWESAALALYLAGDESDFFFGQIFPFAGGWQT